MSVVAGVRFNPKGKDQESKAHLLQFRQGTVLTEASAPLAAWDPACEINDSILAAIIQLLRYAIPKEEEEVVVVKGRWVLLWGGGCVSPLPC